MPLLLLEKNAEVVAVVVVARAELELEDVEETEPDRLVLETVVVESIEGDCCLLILERF